VAENTLGAVMKEFGNQLRRTFGTKKNAEIKKKKTNKKPEPAQLLPGRVLFFDRDAKTERAPVKGFREPLRRAFGSTYETADTIGNQGLRTATNNPCG
jgi:hypothetical protein